MDAIKNLQSRMDHGKVLVLLHISMFVISLVYMIFAFAFNPVPSMANNSSSNATNETLEVYRVPYFYPNLSDALVTGITSLAFAIIGTFIPRLYEESTVVINNSLYLWFVHLCDLWSVARSKIHKQEEFFHSHIQPYQPGQITINFVFLLFLTAVIITSTKLLRKNGSIWPRSDLLKMFTIEGPFVFLRMISAFVFMSNSMVRVWTNLTELVLSGSLRLYYFIFTYFAAQLNVVSVLSHFFSLFWGIPNHFTMGVQCAMAAFALFVNFFLGIMFSSGRLLEPDNLVNTETLTMSSIELGLLALIHGVLCFVAPDFISKVPESISKLSGGENVPSRRSAADQTGGNYDRMDNNQEEEEAVENNTVRDGEELIGQSDRLSLKVLVTTSVSLKRNFVSLFLCSIVFTLVGLIMSRESYLEFPYGALLLLYPSSSLMFRALPDTIREMYLRRELEKPQTVKILTTLFIENILLVLGILSIVAMNLIVARLVRISSWVALASFCILVLNMLHVKNIIRANRTQ